VFEEKEELDLIWCALIGSRVGSILARLACFPSSHYPQSRALSRSLPATATRHPRFCRFCPFRLSLFSLLLLAAFLQPSVVLDFPWRPVVRVGDPRPPVTGFPPTPVFFFWHFSPPFFFFLNALSARLWALILPSLAQTSFSVRLTLARGMPPVVSSSGLFLFLF